MGRANTAAAINTASFARSAPPVVVDIMQLRAERFQNIPSPVLAAMLSQPDIEALVARYPDQILVHMASIRNLMDMADKGTTPMMDNIDRHISCIADINASGAKQLWKPARSDTNRIGSTLLDLDDAGHGERAAALLAGIAILYHDPRCVFRRSYERMGQKVDSAFRDLADRRRIKKATKDDARRDRKSCDSADDAFGGFEVERPDKASNKQWEHWMNVA